MPQNELKQEEIEESSHLVRFIERGDPTITAMLRQKMEQETGDPAVGEEFESWKATQSQHQHHADIALFTEQRQMEGDEVEKLREILQKESRKRAVRRNWIVGGVVTYMSLMVGVAVATHSFSTIGSLGSMTGVLVAAGAVSKGQKQAAYALAQYKNDVRIVGPLAETLWFQDKELPRLAAETLIPLLPQMRASDRSLLNAEQRIYLYRILQGQNTELKLALLKALQQIGDSKALPYVQKLAENSRLMSRDPRLREEIEVCLPFLTGLAEQEKNSQTLLRAADGNATPTDVLLRPAAGPSYTEPEQLLRAAEREE